MKHDNSMVTERQTRVLAEMAAWRRGEVEKVILHLTPEKSREISRAFLRELGKTEGCFTQVSEDDHEI